MNEQATAYALYKKLLALYPRGFRERLGESMQQTFNDLYKERQTEGGWFSFVLWTFVETAMGIVREHVLLIIEGATMKNMLANPRSAAVISFILCSPAAIILLFDMMGVSQDFWPLPISPDIVVPVAFLLLPVALIVSGAPIKLPAIIGFFFVLPFIVLEITFVIIKRLTFDLRDALDSTVIFGILWLGVAAILLVLMPLVRTIRAGKDIIENPARGNSILTNPTSAAIISILLALPFVTILSRLLLNIESPFARLLNDPNPDQPNVIGNLVVLGAFLLAVAACIVARVPIVRTLQAGGSVFAHPMNLMLAVVILFFITRLVVGLIVDQFPCWIGVPNCD